MTQSSPYLVKTLTFTFGAEGGLSMDPNDKGNWTGGQRGVGVLKGTKFGISAKSFPNEDIKNLTLTRATELAKVNFWDPLQCDQMPWPLSMLIFDMGYNSGPDAAKKTLQRALGVAADGAIGPVTLKALRNTSPRDLTVKFLAERIVFLAGLDDWKFFGKGWSRRVIDLAIEGMSNG